MFVLLFTVKQICFILSSYQFHWLQKRSEKQWGGLIQCEFLKIISLTRQNQLGKVKRLKCTTDNIPNLLFCCTS
ncbi:hypothetical protein VTL71DRAFT_14406 [Oculimacula yallundae]|uniref:Uncharacterized protein n=1 Tax=Oculimacula yallundae TaxID=86028 RepID=A0ABR4CIC4_9HELO